MKPIPEFWNEQCGVDRPLETDSQIRRLLNRYVIAALMNTFPDAAIRVFSRSRGELARLLFVEREGGSFRVLRAMYEYGKPGNSGDLLNRLLMQSPAVKAARNRRTIAQRLLEVRLTAHPPGVPALVLAIGGGDGSLEAEVIARMQRQDIYYCSVDKDARAGEENRQVFGSLGLANRGFVFSGNVTEKHDLETVLETAGRRFGVAFEGVSVSICLGIAEYLDMGSPSNDTLAGLLSAIHSCTREDGSLIISQTDYHDRVRFLERGLSWHMRLRDIDELTAEVERAKWQISICGHEPMELISICLARKVSDEYRRIDEADQLPPFRMAEPLAVDAVQRSKARDRQDAERQ
jgi:hypothetical protein